MKTSVKTWDADKCTHFTNSLYYWVDKKGFLPIFLKVDYIVFLKQAFKRTYISKVLKVTTNWPFVSYEIPIGYYSQLICTRIAAIDLSVKILLTGRVKFGTTFLKDVGKTSYLSTVAMEDEISHGAEQLDLSNSNVNPSPGWVFSHQANYLSLTILWQQNERWVSYPWNFIEPPECENVSAASIQSPESATSHSENSTVRYSMLFFQKYHTQNGITHKNPQKSKAKIGWGKSTLTCGEDAHTRSKCVPCNMKVWELTSWSSRLQENDLGGLNCFFKILPAIATQEFVWIRSPLLRGEPPPGQSRAGRAAGSGGQGERAGGQAGRQKLGWAGR